MVPESEPGSESPDALLAEVTALRARVDDLVRSETALREELKETRRIVDRMPVLLYIYDIAQRRNLFANRDLAEMLEFSPEVAATLGPDILGALAHPDDREALFTTHIQRLTDAPDGEVVTLMYRVRDAHGEERWMNSRHTVLERDEAGKPLKILGTVKDITDLKRAEDELARMSDEMLLKAEEINRLKAFVTNARDGIVLTNPLGVYVYANAAFQTLSGYGEGIVGMSILDIVHLDQTSQLASETLPLLVQQGRWEGLVRLKRPDGAEWTAHVNAFTIPITSEGTFQIAAIVRDVTAQLKADEERAALQVRLIEAQREALREIGTPLIPIADGVIAMPLIGAIDEDRAKRLLEVLLQGVSSQRASAAILDITGVKLVDAVVAEVLVRAARAASLLGAEVILTGVGPALAQALVELGADLGGVVVRGTFQSGIAYALGRAQARVAARR
ncbi:MAG TPA: PAS domain S-box protein [Polyangiaceae bacterium]|jgi:PAS domain S-box-containing protein|nr:PAS domain S-box protein [Polyangiaceae bacterium]